MAVEPIIIYSYKIDPIGVLKTLRQLAPDLRVTGPDDNWETIRISGPKRLLRKPWTLTFGHDRNYYAGAEWATQMRGMLDYFARFRQNESTAQIMLLIQSFRFALTTFPPPEPELSLDSEDPRLAYVFAVVKHLDGAVFTPSALRDAAGCVLYGAGEPDPRAVMPTIYKDVPPTPRSQRLRSAHGTIPGSDEPPPPTPQRVARRALALAAVTGRALLEQEDASEPGVDDTRTRILAWVEEVGIGNELEPDEWKILQLPLSVVPKSDAMNATWRLEGLGVLAWALQRFDLLPHDQLVDPGQLLRSVAILNVDKARDLLANPRLRPPEDFARRREQLFALHWRLTEWRLKHMPMNFAETARTAWFGPLDLTGLRLLENDLAVGDQPLCRASADAVAAATSSAMERHLAVNWLNGGSEVYSETDVST